MPLVMAVVEIRDTQPLPQELACYTNKPVLVGDTRVGWTKTAEYRERADGKFSIVCYIQLGIEVLPPQHNFRWGRDVEMYLEILEACKAKRPMMDWEGLVPDAVPQQEMTIRPVPIADWELDIAVEGMKITTPQWSSRPEEPLIEDPVPDVIVGPDGEKRAPEQVR